MWAMGVGEMVGGRASAGVLARALVTLALVLAVVLSGCVPERIDDAPMPEEGSALDLGSDNSSQEALERTTPARVELSDWGKFSINADVVLPAQLDVSARIVRPVLFDDRMPSLLDFFSLEENDLVQQFEEEDGSGTYRRFQNEAGDMLVVMPGSVSYTNRRAGLYANVFVGQPDSTLRSPYDASELEGMTIEEAREKANQAVKALGLNVSLSPRVFSATAEDLNACNNAFTESYLSLDGDLSEEEAARVREELSEDIVDHEFTQDDEIYVIFYDALCGDAPLTSAHAPTQDSGKNQCLEGSIVRVLVGRTGILEVSAEGQYEEIGSAVGQDEGSGSMPVKVEAALESLKERYAGVLSEDTLPIDRIALEYCVLADKTVESGKRLVPVWTFRNADAPDIVFRVDARDEQFLG
ncbi:MAG: hypothetical protein UCH28_08520 [Adlercreutzia sp.]|nr:hypothetical protein [Adlercreutzia sp.]